MSALALELQVMRQQTADYIQWNPTTITLHRPIMAEDGEGGFEQIGEDPVAEQTFRLITQNETVDVVSQTIDGEEINPEFVLLGLYDADVQAGDWFSLADPEIVYDVKYVRDNKNYEIWAGVSKRG